MYVQTGLGTELANLLAVRCHGRDADETQVRERTHQAISELVGKQDLGPSSDYFALWDWPRPTCV